jgi:hypothetical protein
MYVSSKVKEKNSVSRCTTVKTPTNTLALFKPGNQINNLTKKGTGGALHSMHPSSSAREVWGHDPALLRPHWA